MRRSTTGLFFIFFFITCDAQALRVSGTNETGTLVFSGGTNGSYRSLFYKNDKGERFNIFDSGLEFNYVEGSDSYLSPDKTHFFVNFSETGSIEDGASPAIESKVYMCAFVRMSDGCVVRVDTGGICGGKWDTTSKWIGIDGLSTRNLFGNPLSVSKVYRDYSSNVKDALVATSPRILKYLPEGTAFDNLLACDPVNSENKEYYEKLLQLLRRDGDLTDAKKVIKAIRK